MLKLCNNKSHHIKTVMTTINHIKTEKKHKKCYNVHVQKIILELINSDKKYYYILTVMTKIIKPKL